MRFSKKILATLLPITAASALAPALSSCSKGSSWDINYGDEINCLDEKAENYHSLDTIKDVVKKHVSIEMLPTMNYIDFASLREGEIGYHLAYYDLVATLAISNNIKFHLTYSIQNRIVNLTYLENNVTKSVEATIDWTTDTPKQEGDTTPIYIDAYGLEGDEFRKLSYMYQNTRVEYSD